MNWLRDLIHDVCTFFSKQQPPTINQVLQASIEEHEHKLIASQDRAAYHRKMSEYHRESLQRLRAQLYAKPDTSMMKMMQQDLGRIMRFEKMT